MNAEHVLLQELFNGNLQAASQWALDMALAARTRDGIAGTLVIKIPRNIKDQMDVAFVAGKTQMALEF